LNPPRKKLVILEVINDGITTSDERREHLDAHDFEVLVAYYFRNNPFIYTLKLWDCLAIKSPNDYEAIGCGQDIANLVLADAKLRVMPPAQGFALSVYTVELCKRFDQACGGQFQHLAILKETMHYPISFSEWSVDHYVKAVNKMHTFVHSNIATELVKIVNDNTLKKSEEAPPT